jgi:hypothetical protein
MKFKSLLLVIMVALLPVTSWATTYYVAASSGSDSNSGISETAAWRTLGKVKSMTLKPGDVVLFKRGEVWKEAVTMEIKYSGTQTNWIVFADYGTGNLPKFDFSSNSGEGFYINNQDYIMIKNLHIYDAYMEGISVYGQSADHINGFQLIGCYIERNGVRRGSSDFGIDARYVDDLTISGTTFDGNQQSGTRIQSCRNVTISKSEAKNHVGGDDHDGFLIQNTDGLQMFDCIAHHNSESGIDLGGYEAYDEPMRNAYVYRCAVYNNGDDGIAISGCQNDDSTPFYTYNIYFFYCLSYSNGTYNLKMYMNAYNLYFYNCVFDGSGSHNVKWDTGSHDVTFRNCIVSNSGGSPVHSWTDNVYAVPNNWNADFMIWYPDVPNSTYRGTKYWASDPKFTNREIHDYTIRPESFAIDAGANLGEDFKDGLDPASTDIRSGFSLDQNANGSGWEIGAFVFPAGNSGTPTPAPPSNLRLTN